MTHSDALSSKALGQISLMQSVVTQLPDKVSMLNFVARGMKDINGVAHVTFYQTEMAPDSGFLQIDQNHLKIFPISYKGTNHATIVFELSSPNEFEPYAPFIENFVNMLGVIFEERHQRQLNKDIMANLENLISERTSELETANTALRNEVEQRKKIALELEEKSFFIEQILDTTPNLIYIYDLVGHKNIFSNKEETELLGYSVSQIQAMGSKAIEPVIHEEDLPAVLVHHNKMKTVPNNEVHEIIYRAMSSGGEWKWLLSRDVAFSRSEDGNVTHILGIAEDITEKKESEEIRLRLEEQLRQAHKMEAIGTMAGGVAHDFNNLIGIILGNAELALDDIPEKNPATAYMSEIKHASMRAKEIVQQLLSFTRKTEKDKTVFALQTIVKETLGLIRASTPSYIKIRTDIQEDTGPIEADPTQMHQVVLNLVTNSIHSIKKDGVIGIEISGVDIRTSDKNDGLKPGRYIRLAVIDSGEGIPDHNLEKIFDPYFTTKDVGKGTGMGLSVVHGIVKNHDGAVTIDSTLNQGTCVTIFLPEFQGEYNLLKAENKKPEITENNEQILLVDDEPALTLLMKKMLVKFGYKVQDYIDSNEAYRRFVANPQEFDLIITDMTMPGMSGLQLVEKIREIHTDIPIIMCTGYSEQIDYKKAISIGITAYLEKPITKAKIADAIQDVLTGR